MRTLNKSNLLVIKEYNNNKSISNSSFFSCTAAASPRLQYYNYYREDISLK